MDCSRSAVVVVDSSRKLLEGKSTTLRLDLFLVFLSVDDDDIDDDDEGNLCILSFSIDRLLSKVPSSFMTKATSSSSSISFSLVNCTVGRDVLETIYRHGGMHSFLRGQNLL